jgi:ATP-dependent RNA helicase DDX24/MAK5
LTAFFELKIGGTEYYDPARTIRRMSRLRKRSGGVDESGPNLKKRRKSHNLARNAGTVVADERLQWREVAVLDRLGDAEGFSGLEEIDDVEVVKDEDEGCVQFRVSYSIRTRLRNNSDRVTVDTNARQSRFERPHSHSEDSYRKTIVTKQTRQWRRGMGRHRRPRGRRRSDCCR